MLIYVSHGPRDFGSRPVSPNRRNTWEFYAVLRGRIAPVLPDAALPASKPLISNALWLFPPESKHGWRGELRRHASVAVFHFDQLPPEMVAHVTEPGGLRVSLTRAESGRISRLAHELQPLLWSHDPLLALESDRAALELSVLVLRKCLAQPAVNHTNEARVLAAERWFGANLERRPTLTSVACQLGVSLAHLRRMFVAARGQGPKAVLEALRLARAELLLAADDLKLDAVARASGYTSASVFVQAFRKAHGVTPDVWRRARTRAD